VKNIEEISRKIRKDIGEEINEIFLICCNDSLFSNTPPQTDGRNFLQFVFFFFFFFCVGPGLQIVPQRLKIKPTMGQKKLKTGSGFETLPQTRDWANNGPKRRGPTMGLNELGPLNICFEL